MSDTHHEGLIKSKRVRASELLESVSHNSGGALRQKGPEDEAHGWKCIVLCKAQQLHGS